MRCAHRVALAKRVVIQPSLDPAACLVGVCTITGPATYNLTP